MDGFKYGATNLSQHFEEMIVLSKPSPPHEILDISSEHPHPHLPDTTRVGDFWGRLSNWDRKHSPVENSCGYKTIFWASGKSSCMHRSVSGLGVQNLNAITILKIIWLLFDHFFRYLLLSEKCCHSLFIWSKSRISWKQNANLSASIEGDCSLDLRLGV